MTDIHIRKQGRAGRITLTRPRALNALTYDMCMAIEAALDEWRDDDAVSLVLLDAEGDKAFCASKQGIRPVVWYVCLVHDQ